METDPKPESRPPEGEPSTGEILRALWGKLTQMRVVLHILVALAAASLVGTAVPQNQSPETYTERFGNVAGKLMLALGLDHVFSAWWFLLLVGLLMLSLVACSRRLWRLAKGRWQIPDAQRAPGIFDSANSTVRARCSEPLENAANRLSQAARRRGYASNALGDADGARWVYLSRFRWVSWGTVLTHYALFLVAIGALMGQLPGVSVDGYAMINVGETYADPDGELPFSLRLDRFEIKRDDATGSIENYYSDLVVVEDGREALKQTISVNRPLRYRHFYISQSGWGAGGVKVNITAGGEVYEAVFPLERGRSAEGETGWFFNRESAAVILPGGNTALVARRFCADAVREDGKVYDLRSGHVGNPAVEFVAVSDFSKGGHDVKELPLLFSGERAEVPGGSVEFAGVTYWSGLGVRKDLGVPLVWTGFIGCLLGMMMVFYVRPVKALVRLTPAGDEGTEIAVGFSAGPGSELDEGVWRGIIDTLADPALEDADNTSDEVAGK